MEYSGKKVSPVTEKPSVEGEREKLGENSREDSRVTAGKTSGRGERR